MGVVSTCFPRLDPTLEMARLINSARRQVLEEGAASAGTGDGQGCAVTCPAWMFDGPIADAPGVLWHALSTEQAALGLHRLACVSRSDIRSAIALDIGPPTDEMREFAAQPIANQVVNRSVTYSCSSEWLGAPGTTLHDSFSLSAFIPLDARLIDDRFVTLDIDDPTPDSYLFIVTDNRAVVRAAKAYLDIMTSGSAPLQPEWRNPKLKPTHRELSVLRMLATGGTEASIARQLGVSDRHVRKIIKHLYDLFSVESRFELGAAYMTWLNGR